MTQAGTDWQPIASPASQSGGGWKPISTSPAATSGGWQPIAQPSPPAAGPSMSVRSAAPRSSVPDFVPDATSAAPKAASPTPSPAPYDPNPFGAAAEAQHAIQHPNTESFVHEQGRALANSLAGAATDIYRGVGGPGLSNISPITGKAMPEVPGVTDVPTGRATTPARVLGGSLPMVGAGVLGGPIAGAAVGAAQGVGSARREGEEQGLTAGQTASLAGERGLFNAVLGAIPGGKAAQAGISGAFTAAAQAYGLNVGQAVFENHLKDDLGIKTDTDWQALKNAATSGDNIAQSALMGGIHHVVTKFGTERPALEKPNEQPQAPAKPIPPVPPTETTAGSSPKVEAPAFIPDAKGAQNATSQVVEQGRVQEQPQGGNEHGQTPEAGTGNRVQRPAEGGWQEIQGQKTPEQATQRPSGNAPDEVKPVSDEAIGQRGLSAGPPGPLQIGQLVSQAKDAGLLGMLRGVRERFSPIESKYGSDIAKAFIKTAAAPSPEANTLASSFIRRAFGGDETKAQEWTDLGRFYRQRDLQSRLGPTAGTALPSLPPAEVARLEADPVIQKATAMYNKEIAPALQDIRTRNGMIMNSNASNPKAFPFFLNLPGEFGGPAGTDTSVNPNFAFNKAATGNQQLLMDPKESLAAAIRGHLATDYKQQLVNTIKSNYTIPQASVVPSGRNSYQGVFRGKATDVVPVDLGQNGSPVPDIHYVPKQIAHEYNNIHQDRGQFDTLFDKAIQAGTKAATIGDFSPHTARVIAHVAAREAQSGRNVAGLLPSWLGSNIAAARRMIQMSGSPIGETMQLLIDRSGSDKGQGFDVKPGQTRIQQWLAKPHDLLFNPDHGVDPMGRRVVAEAYLTSTLGRDAMNKIQTDLDSGALTPAAASAQIEKSLSDAKFVGLGRRVNDTLGFANKQTRSDLLNQSARIFPFISSESGMIPREVGKLANIDAPALLASAKRGDWRQAALQLGGMLATGSIGTYLGGNALNYGLTKAQTGTGKFMWDNDDGHKLDIQVAPNWYLSNLDPTFARGMRLAGLKGLANGENPLHSAGLEAVNLPLSTMAKTLQVAFSTAMYMATRGSVGKDETYAPYVTTDAQGKPGLLKTNIAGAIGVPLVRNTAQAMESGKPLAPAIAQDAASNTVGAQLKYQNPGLPKPPKRLPSLPIQRR